MQLMGETILLVGSISLGLVAYLVADIRLRRAFLDTRQSFEMRLTIESQVREQVKPKSHSIASAIKLMAAVSLTRTVVVLYVDDPKKNKTKKGAIAVVCLARTRRRQDASGPWNSSRWPIQKDLHESTRKRQVSSFNIFFFFFELNVYFIRW
jgi:hypothetical protein